MIHVFIVGSKGIPARYGGFETFVENLTAKKRSDQIKYHVSCMDNDEKHFEHNGADCFNVKLPIKGAPGRILHVGRALTKIEKWIQNNPDQKVVVMILGCRIGPLLIPHSRKLHKQGAKIYCNPDGLEWKRSKWSKPAKLFLRYCEKCLVQNSDYIICDSVNIERYIKETYGDRKNKTTFIAYGANVELSNCDERRFYEWMNKYDVKPDEYYLIVGRFVPENNYETMIREFIKSDTKKDLIIVTNVENNKLYKKLCKTTSFEHDKRIKFVGTVYDQELLTKIRECAYGYFHGHEVGGTNPSLLEALASTRTNLLLDIGFNREVAEDSAMYWNKETGNLSSLINRVDSLEERDRNVLATESKKRVLTNYNWDSICMMYEEAFVNAEHKQTLSGDSTK